MHRWDAVYENELLFFNHAGELHVFIKIERRLQCQRWHHRYKHQRWHNPKSKPQPKQRRTTYGSPAQVPMTNDLENTSNPSKNKQGQQTFIKASTIHRRSLQRPRATTTTAEAQTLQDGIRHQPKVNPTCTSTCARTETTMTSQ
jgi:hypothetical protein